MHRPADKSREPGTEPPIEEPVPPPAPVEEPEFPTDPGPNEDPGSQPVRGSGCRSVSGLRSRATLYKSRLPRGRHCCLARTDGAGGMPAVARDFGGARRVVAIRAAIRFICGDATITTGVFAFLGCFWHF